MPNFKRTLSYANRPISYLLTQVNQQTKLRKQVQSVLPNALAKQILACRIKNETLIIHISSAAWASQCRFYSRTIQQAIVLRSQTNIKNVQIKILLFNDIIQTTKPAKIPCSETIKQLKKTDNPEPTDKLEQALLRLSKTLEKHSNS